MKILLVLSTFIASSALFALEIDEKLTLRFLKVSNSKKTVLINRGAEDALALGDHAKFFITSGVIARGVVEKVSPSRSIWSLYRVVDPAEITDGKVLNLKIASPVKITVDPTKSMKEEEIPGGTDSMSMSDGEAAPDTAVSTPGISSEEKDELEGMGLEETEKPIKNGAKTKKSTSSSSSAPATSVMEETPVYGTNTSKNWEVWGTLYVNSLSGTVEDGQQTDATSTASTASAIDFSAGIERYFLTSDSFLKNTSLVIFAHKRTLESGDSIKLSTDWFEFGGGVNYHFYNSAAAVNRLIAFAGVNAGAGSADIKETVITNGVSTETPVSGSNNFFSAGLGAKYVLSNGFGVRGLLDYYSSSETYDFGEGQTIKRTLSGPRVLFGVSYRF